jgi:tRNA dimethylallyltransferase
MAQQKILIITGPTASGKSDLGVRLANKFKGEIISADSRQVYKYLNIGTGKITKKEMQGLPHHLLDVAEPKEQFSASEYKNLAEKKIEEIIARNRLPIIVGGTGFYIDTITCAVLFPNVPPNKILREKLSKLTVEKLFAMLKNKDPERAKAIDPYNKLRLVRALEIIDTLGKVPSLGSKKQETRYKFIYVGIKPANLEERIHERLLKRIPGMVKEAKRLLKNKKLTHKRMQELGLEYRFLSYYLQGKLTKDAMTEKLNTAIRQYSKRQMTWFKRNKAIKWFTPSRVEGFNSKEYKDIEKYVKVSLDK